MLKKTVIILLGGGMQLVCLESLVKKDHPYRKFSTVLDFEELLRPLKQINNEGKTGATG